MSSAIREAAIRYCAARDRAVALRRSLKHCQRRVYDSDRDENGDAPTLAEVNPDNAFCSRAMGGRAGDGLATDEFCDACRANLPVVEDLKRARHAKGAAASTLFRLCRRATAAATVTGRAEFVAGLATEGLSADMRDTFVEMLDDAIGEKTRAVEEAQRLRGLLDAAHNQIRELASRVRGAA